MEEFAWAQRDCDSLEEDKSCLFKCLANSERTIETTRRTTNQKSSKVVDLECNLARLRKDVRLLDDQKVSMVKEFAKLRLQFKEAHADA